MFMECTPICKSDQNGNPILSEREKMKRMEETLKKLSAKRKPIKKVRLMELIRKLPQPQKDVVIKLNFRDS